MGATTPARLYRDPTNQVVAGVASGIAAHLHASKFAVRLTFLILASFSGLGAMLYAAFWAVLPHPPGAPGTRRNVGQLVSFIALGLGMMIAVQSSDVAKGARSLGGWLVALVAIGAGVIWHNADAKSRQRWSGAMPRAPWLGLVMQSDRQAYLLRFLGGGTLIIGGIIGVVGIVYSTTGITGTSLTSLLLGLVFALIALAGVSLAMAPVLWRTFAQLRTEREARIREQERAELAAMIHDQVLHTLALIQRNAEDVKSVMRLARGQERSLRNWLYGSTASPSERLSAGLEQAAAEVEDTYGITVETVMVGDHQMDDRVAALVAAAREAMVNAAKHAKVSSVSLYSEVEEHTISVFVRDRGVGFDQSTVADDRLGVRGSIIGRMRRHGGRAEIRSQVGDGTEVRLTMPVDGDGGQATRSDHE